MGLNTWLRDIVRAALVPFGGTIAVPSDGDEFPIIIANEAMGGHHNYRTLEELADAHKSRIVPGMSATVLRHVRPDTTVFERKKFVFDPTDEILALLDDVERISDIDGYDVSLFWKPENADPSTASTAEIESQYADSQDYGRVGDPATPAFQPPLISSENYQAGKKSDADSSIIWVTEYDPTIHKYERQRLGAAGNWGIPKLINTTSYSQGDYVDNRFIWVDKNEVPTRPPSLVGGKSNGEPAGWENTPAVPDSEDYYDYIVDHDLFKISAQKDAFGSLKSEWSTPQKISTDPNLVRYGNNPSSTDFIADGGGDTADWRGYFTPGTDTHMATRADGSSPWRIQNIDNEEGEYVDYIFKAFPLGDEPDEDDRPTISNPFSELEDDYPNNGWKDYPFAVEDDEVLYRSVGRKYNNGQLKPSGWSVPTRSDGKDTIQTVIEPVGATLFKYDGAGVVSPSTIVLKAKLYRGKDEVTPDVPFEWYKGAVDGANKIIKDSAVGVSQYHTITGTNNDTLTISPEAVDQNQTYNLKGILSGEDYYDPISILDVTDGLGIIAVVESDGGYVYKNTAGSKIFTARLFINGVEVVTGKTYKWLLGATEISTTQTAEVDAADFTDQEVLNLEITYDGEVYKRNEMLVDLTDAPATLTEYSTQEVSPDTWTTDPAGAIWMRLSTDGGDTWDIIKVKGESAPYNGGFYRSAFKNSASQPAASGVSGSLLPTGSGWTGGMTTPGDGEAVWEVSAFFEKNPANSDTSLTSANWNIVGSWSTAIRKTGVDGDVAGPPGAAGPVGWSAVLAVITVSSTKEVLQVVDWINLGGADSGTKPPTGYYLSAAGHTTDINAAKNVKGSQGGDANTRPMYLNEVDSRRFTTPTTTINQGTAIYCSSVMTITNAHSSARYFRIVAEIPVSNDSGNDSFNGFLLRSGTTSFPSNPETGNIIDSQYTRIDYANTEAKIVHKIKLDAIISIAAGATVYTRLAIKHTQGTAGKYAIGFTQAYGL